LSARAILGSNNRSLDSTESSRLVECLVPRSPTSFKDDKI